MTQFDYSLHYSQWHDDSEEYRRRRVEEQTRLLEVVLADFPRGGPAADIGCGTGYLMQALSTLGFEPEGLESDPAQAAKCRAAGLAVTESNDIRAFAAARPQKFTLVTMFDILEHLPVADQLDLLAVVHSTIAPGGALVIQTPNALSPVAAYQRYVDWTHTSAFTTVSIRPLLLNAGFSAVRFAPDYVPASWRHPHLRTRVVRKVWRFVVNAELGTSRLYREMPLGKNMLVVASA